ncbi:MAG: FtsW/RodA/SpoVE family cell cycle protein [Lachnospiraceae bacterium]|nr:FtsW/RodA/SpoVE family cell cycle protein [Lachnospiraceae bacterium]
MFTKFNRKDYNFKLLFMVMIIIAIGTVIINSANSDYLRRQIFGVVLGFIVMIFVSLIDYEFICKFYKVFFVINIGLLAMVLLFGTTVNNARRWVVIAGVQFQPSELTKIFMIIFSAAFLDKYKDEINTFKCLAQYALYCGITMFLVIAEPDLSTTLCLAMILVTILYISGISYKIIGLAILILVPIAGSFLWYIQRPDQKLLKEYQVGRILQFIYPEQYGEDFSQQNNSIMAIGSGQLSGKGLNTSTMATVKDANFISEQQTDFIFSVVGEELGFIGSVIIIAIILLIVLQCISIGRKAKDTKGMLIATGVGMLIAYQSFINIGVATGILPNTGIPLPFISYGLSSLLSISLGMGMVLNVSIQKLKY